MCKRRQRNAQSWRLALWLSCSLIATACQSQTPQTSTLAPPTIEQPTATRVSEPTAEPPHTPVLASMDNIIPKPVSATPTGAIFTLTSDSDIYIEPDNTEMRSIGEYLAAKLNPATGYELHVLAANGAPASGNIYLTSVGGSASLGEEGYELTIAEDSVVLIAYRPAGLFRGVQTIRQLLPPAIESPTLQPDAWQMPSGTIRDHPRFEWRGAMLDVARHFFGVADVKRYIDLLAYYKINRFHMHLSDDQGWRIAIESWPNLATVGGSTQVGGGDGGYYTQDEYSEIVAYAQARYIVAVPEIDMPGHTNAALASYAELNCSGNAPAVYSGTEVGFSSLCTANEITYTFIDDVIREIAALTPGAYIHIGGDEAKATEDADYIAFIERVQTIVQAHGKQMIGWEEIAQAKLLPTSIAQHWNSDLALRAIAQGAQIIMSPASKAYVDMKYDETTRLGLDWAGYTNVRDAYTWDPVTRLDGVSESDVLGLEASLWTETIETNNDIDFMAFPRLIGYAEIGWSPATGRDWNEYIVRLGTHGARLDALGVKFYRAPEIPWQ